VPANPSSSIPAALAHLAHADPLRPADAPHLLAYLAAIHDRRRAVAVDGKTLPGARPDGRQVHLLAAMDHATRAVLAQRQVDGAPGEVPAFAPLLAGLELAGVVVTADALYGSRNNASYAEVPVMPRWWAVALLLGVTVPGRSA
jgi:Transposase DDE domain